MLLKRLVATTCMTLAGVAGVAAQGFPTKQISMMMPYAAGGPGDAIARIVAQGMSEALKQQVYVENVGGAGGTIGTSPTRPIGSKSFIASYLMFG